MAPQTEKRTVSGPSAAAGAYTGKKSRTQKWEIIMGILAAYAVPHPPLLIPGVGDDSKKSVQKTKESYEEVARRAAALKPETLVIFSPHAPLYADYFHISPGAGARGDFGYFRAGNAACSVSYDQEFVGQLEELLARRGIPGGTMGEKDPTLDHATMVPLYFFGQAAGDEGGAGKGVKVVRIGLSGLSNELHREFGKAVADVAVALDRKVVIIASGDLSHKLLASGPYGFVPEGPELDKQICAALADGSESGLMAIDERLADTGAECGLRSFIMMGGALEGLTYTSELLSYEGPLGVGYAIASFTVDTEAKPEEPSLPVQLARQTLQSFFNQDCRRPTLATPEIEECLERYRQGAGAEAEAEAVYESLAQSRAGAFVSLHKHGDLRGCIGTIAPTQESVLAEIVQNAVSAAREDPRFPPVQPAELESLTIKVDVLGEAEPVTDRQTLDAQRYGVIVSRGHRRGLLLPALEGVDTPEEQIAIALSKAGIRSDETYDLERFEVVRYT